MLVEVLQLRLLPQRAVLKYAFPHRISVGDQSRIYLPSFLLLMVLVLLELPLSVVPFFFFSLFFKLSSSSLQFQLTKCFFCCLLLWLHLFRFSYAVYVLDTLSINFIFNLDLVYSTINFIILIELLLRWLFSLFLWSRHVITLKW